MILKLKIHYETFANIEILPYWHQCLISWIDSLKNTGHFIITGLVHLKD